jgi:hypothetical protein
MKMTLLCLGGGTLVVGGIVSIYSVLVEGLADMALEATGRIQLFDCITTNGLIICGVGFVLVMISTFLNDKKDDQKSSPEKQRTNHA